MSRGRHVAKTFNPTLFIQSIQREEVVTEEVEEANPGTFEKFAIHPDLKRNILQKGYLQTTPIQDQVIPNILAGHDVIGIANTGTGKTAAFLVPLIDKILNNREAKVLIVAPTRELAGQIKDEFVSFSRGLGIYAVLCIGGNNIHRQKDELRRPYNFVIGTPGRLKELISERFIQLAPFRFVVLDETDLMVDIGFIKDIKEIISLLPKERQSLFFSATVDGKTREVLTAFVRNPVTISVKTHETPLNVRHEIVPLAGQNKIDKLLSLLGQKEYEKVLIFGRTKHGVQKLSDELVKRGFSADAIHGNKKQGQRQRTLDRFKRNEIQILLATDVASRGLDIPNVTHVINYELPESQDAYIHRIGRTGRADKKGVALTFV